MIFSNNVQVKKGAKEAGSGSLVIIVCKGSMPDFSFTLKYEQFYANCIII